MEEFLNHAQEEKDLWLKALMEHIPDLIYFKDRQSRFRAANQAMLERLDKDSMADVVGRSDTDFYGPEHAEDALNDEHVILKSGMAIINKEEKETWPDGHETWVTTTKLPLRNRSGEIIGTFGISRDITDRVLDRQALEDYDRELRHKHEQMMADMERARTIQLALLPPTTNLHGPLFVEYWNLPLDAVGGDFVTICQIDSKTVGILAADVSGHGVSAALFTTLLRFLADRIITEHGHEPAEFLRLLNEELMARLPHSFMTAVYGCFDISNSDVMKISLAAGGHPPPMLLRAESEVCEMIELPNEGAIGILQNFDATPVELELRPGDRLFFYSDGITEYTGRAQDMIGEEGFCELLRNSNQNDLHATMQTAMASIMAHGGGGAQEDDMLLVACEMRPAPRAAAAAHTGGASALKA